ncbi:hypothetical protein AB0L63_29850 [Nocardia sp. NPDC051990]|uniref:hypothetical protein n=1 Tax=Nocardia sp. NPDC051990 TaxID=3155285 RepID=UPI0034143D29
MSSATFGAPIHTKPGESLADSFNIPGIVLFALGVVGLASTLTAAAHGFAGWTKLAALTTALLFLTSISLFLLEHERLRRLATHRAITEPAATDPAGGEITGP